MVFAEELGSLLVCDYYNHIVREVVPGEHAFQAKLRVLCGGTCTVHAGPSRARMRVERHASLSFLRFAKLPKV